MPKKITFFTILAVLISFFSYQNAIAQQQNVLTSSEKADGWQLLFNGKDLSGWHSYLEKAPGKAWQVKDGMIFLNKNSNSVEKDFADLVTNDEYDNFDFKMEWKMEPCQRQLVRRRAC